MKRSTLLTFVGLLLLTSLASTGCKRVAPAPVSQSVEPADYRVTLMPESSGEIARIYSKRPAGTTTVTISFIDGSKGEMVALDDGIVTPRIISGEELHPDGSRVVYDFRGSSDGSPVDTSYFRADGTKYVRREVEVESIKHTFYAADGQTVFRVHAENSNGQSTDVIFRPNGKTTLVEMESWHKTSTRITLFDENGKPEYNEFAFFGGDRSVTSIKIDWYQNGLLKATEKWHTSAEDEVVDSRSLFNDAGKEILLLKPTAEFAGSRAVRKWVATSIDATTGQSTVSEVTDLEFVNYPEMEVVGAKEGARHIFEEYTGLNVEAGDHASSFKHF